MLEKEKKNHSLLALSTSHRAMDPDLIWHIIRARATSEEVIENNP